MTSLRVFRWTPFVLVVVLAALLAAPSAGAALRDNGDGTVTDPATALTWVADPDFAAAAGFGRWVGHAEAIALVRAMNAGEVESFGRTDWRLPTARERATLEAPPAGGGGDGPRRLAASSRTGPGLVEVRPVSGSALVAGIADAAVTATHSVWLERDVVVAGDVVANGGGGATLAPGWEVQIDRNVRVEGDVAGDRVRLDRDVAVLGTVAANALAVGKATTVGATSTPLALPVFSLLPPLAASLPRETAPAVSVGPEETLELDAGEYQDVVVAERGTLLLTGGTYHLGGLDLGARARLVFGGPVEVRVRDRVRLGDRAEIVPEDGSGLDGGDALLAVGGIDGADGLLGSLPRAIEIGARTLVRANLHAADGSVAIGQWSIYEGAIVGRDVWIGQRSELALASAWANRPPLADPQTVLTAGAASIVLTLTGSDPEGGDLSFAIVDPPDHGSVSTPVPIVPPLVPGRDGGPAVQPAVTSASVTYTPAGAGDVADAFTFEVVDPLGSFGTAVVSVDPPGAEQPPPPPPGTVVAADLSATVREGASGILAFTASAPGGVDLAFSLVAGSGPAHGTLGAVVPGGGSPVRTATAQFVPDAGFTGSDGFAFDVCGVVASVLVCDQAVYSIEVVAVPVETGELAADRQVAAVEDVPLVIDLVSGSTRSQAEEGSVAGTLRVITGEAVGIAAATVAGNVADADGDGLGDGHNALPGPAPGLISAGVGQSGGAGSNGTVRVHIEYDVSFFSGLIGDLVSAQVLLTTRRGTVDALDTGFWWIGDDGNGTLEASDFERPGEALGVTMPVPASQAVGEDGSFGFSVLPVLRAAVAAGHQVLTLQGRVDESLLGPGRGLQVYSTADGNLFPVFRAPALSFSTPPPLPPTLLVTITALPQFGTLLTPGGQPIVVVPTSLSSTAVTYVPNAGFVGSDSFGYEVTDFASIDTGVVTVVVQAGSCAKSAGDCDDGR